MEGIIVDYFKISEIKIVVQFSKAAYDIKCLKVYMDYVASSNFEVKFLKEFTSRDLYASNSYNLCAFVSCCAALPYSVKDPIVYSIILNSFSECTYFSSF